MEKLKNFQVAAYVYAYTLDRLSDEEIRRGLDYFLQYIDFFFCILPYFLR